MSRYIIFLFLIILKVYYVVASPYSVCIKINENTGGISDLKIIGDPYEMNWLVATDGSQYSWATERYGWGLGYFTSTVEHESVKYEWNTPVKKSSDGMYVEYTASDIKICVERLYQENRLLEKYKFINTGSRKVALSDIGIYTPFNDNYPDAETCVNKRTNVHIWEGGNAAYISAVRMGGNVPHLGLVVSEGAVKSYEIWERGIMRENSQTRGIFALNLPDFELKPNECYSLEWIVFPHNGKEDFNRCLLDAGSVLASSEQYVYEVGDTAKVTLHSKVPLQDCEAMVNGVPVSLQNNGNCYTVEMRLLHAGNIRFDFLYNGGKSTHVDCLVVSDEERLIDRRIDFICNNQQMKSEGDLRFGAFMVYDTEGDSIYLNNTPNVSPADRDEGGERLGMGILLAKKYRVSPSVKVKEALLKYADFVRNKLQTQDFVTYSTVDHKGRNRGYNYPWVATFYFQMYFVTNDPQYAMYGYKTMRAFYKQFGYGFYAIEIPVCVGLHALKLAGMDNEYKQFMKDLKKMGDVYIANGVNYPKHEVNYEQSIVAPSVLFLLQLYYETKERKYLDEAKKQLPVLEAFSWTQPSFHLNEIGIRHWDGYWFGKRECFGDTFPHHWSTITAAVFHYYALCTGDFTYRRRAENIVRNNLCLFSEDGKASCAYLYPYRINGYKAKFYDPYANDQDWALVYYYLINKGI